MKYILALVVLLTLVPLVAFVARVVDHYLKGKV
jgi:hypothetical protein